ncbi:MAG: glycosyltransferase family 4 protein [Vulcanimicrobiaceae bacterium]
MAVLATTEFPPPGYGGIERYMVRLAGEIAAAGHPLTVVAPEMPGCAQFDRSLPYRVIRFKFPGHGNPEPLPVWSYRVREKVIEAHRDMPDKCTIASSWPRSGLACATLPKSLRGDLAIVAHGSEILSQRSMPRRSVMQLVFHRADVAVANSAFTKRLLVEAKIQTPIVVSRCGIDRAPLYRAPAAVPTILSVGRLVRRKGFDMMIEALPALLDRFANLRYEIVGVGPDCARFRERVRELGLDDHVAFLGDISDEELQQAYARAWCFALPTRRVGTGDVEGFGIVYLEAAMAGLPSIGGLNSGAEDAIADGKSGLLVDGNDPAAIARAVGYLLADPDRARALGQYGRNRALNEFTWRLTADTIMRSLGRVPRENACSA